MKKTLRYLPIFTLLFFINSTWAGSRIQQQKKGSSFQPKSIESLSIITGFHTGSENHNFLEIGLAKKIESINIHYAYGIVGVANEFRYSDDFVWGFKVGSRFGTGGLDIGLQLVNYTDFEENALRLRPEFGFGFGKLQLYLGYNIPIINNDFDKINPYVLGINFLIDVKSVEKKIGITDSQPPK